MLIPVVSGVDTFSEKTFVASVSGTKEVRERLLRAGIIDKSGELSAIYR